ncbi:MAG: lytic transglycosylase domain-containing protein [Deltaproteobacteria bacterium]|nr:lytic transglycosylase domain-containing protein [Deltaproteobacteria bacterium]
MHTSYLKTLLLFTLTGIILFLMPSSLSADIRGYLGEDGYWCFGSGDNLKRYERIIRQAAERFKVEKALIIAVIKAESDFDCRAVSIKGAQGLMQIMPDTASYMNLKEPFNPEENIIAGTCYLRLLLERFNYSKRLALAAYHAGPETVEAYHGMPPFTETRNYVRNVLNYYDYYSRGY